MASGYTYSYGSGDMMKNRFVAPDLSDGVLEVRADGQEVAIYGSPDGLRWLAQKCLVLVDKDKSGHIHLEDYEKLTKNSEHVALVLCKN